jgi:cytochrome c oxidase cbb3-type subunit 3
MATTEHAPVDPISGTATTGHEWDGIRELNTPLPRWWLWIFYATIAFSVVYWLFYPAWPLIWGSTGGILGYSTRGQVARDLGDIKTVRASMEGGLANASVAEIAADKKLLALALAHGKAAFAENCAPCHGSGGQGSKGYRNLTDDDWLWGGTLEEIQTTITHGIRADYDKDTRSSTMPAFGKDGILKADEIKQVADFVRTLSKLSPEPGIDLEAGKKIFADNCAVCHGDNGKGKIELGAANLTGGLRLYGSDMKDLIQTIAYARNSTMPAWGSRLDPVTIKALTVYVHSLGGGQ